MRRPLPKLSHAGAASAPRRVPSGRCRSSHASLVSRHGSQPRASPGAASAVIFASLPARKASQVRPVSLFPTLAALQLVALRADIAGIVRSASGGRCFSAVVLGRGQQERVTTAHVDEERVAALDVERLSVR